MISFLNSPNQPAGSIGPLLNRLPIVDALSIKASKIQVPESIESFEELKEYLDSHLRGELCANCEDIITTELGKLFFYSAALCNTLNINMYDVFLQEYKRLTTLESLT